jgi:hypothetical protein
MRPRRSPPGAPASVIVDRQAAAIDAPSANEPLAGDIAITGSAPLPG